MKIIKIFTIAAVASTLMTSCHNGDNEFPDFDYQTVYFARPTAGRTIELGKEPEADVTDDNQHRFRVKAVMGGVYENNRDRKIGRAHV